MRIIDLDIEGMTCASCVARVERKLGKLEGVQALVNLPLETAKITAPTAITDEQVIETVNAAGYRARLREASTAGSTPTTAGAARDDAAGIGAVPPGADSERRESVGSAAARGLLPRLILAAVLTLPVFVLSMVPAAEFPNWGWVSFALTLPVVTWSAWGFHRAAAVNARHLASTMDTLVSLGVTAAFLFSSWQLVSNPLLTAEPRSGMVVDELYFEVAAVVVTFLLLGRYLEARAKYQAGDALKSLLSLGAKDAAVLRNGMEIRVPIQALVAGDVFVVRPGEKIATDGVVVEGTSAVDASLITGESVAVDVAPNDTVIGATINASGRLLVRATRTGADTTLAQMGRLVSEAQSGKAPIARLADRISAVFVPVVLAIAVVTFVAWIIATGDPQSALTAAVAVLVIACPCALGLATPVGLLTGTGRGAQLGILIRGPQVLEDTRKVDTMVLDKTGTVTTGKLSVSRVLPLGQLDEQTLLSLAGAVEAASEHPIARAIAAKAAESAPLLPVSMFSSAPGGGVKGTVADRSILAGRTGWMKENGVHLSPTHLEALKTAQNSGATAVWVAVDGEAAGILSLTDTLRDGSAAAIGRFRAMGLRPILLTGDNEAVAREVARQVGIAQDDVIADVLPAGKLQTIVKLQAGGATVAMAGDGVNDAAALAQADLGIAMGSGTDVAIQAADLTVMGNSLGQAVQAIDLSRRTLAIIKSNLFWAFFYNAVGIPIAALGLLNPMIAGGAMAASSVLVVANSLRLRRFGA
ncbi:MAG: copper-translocating P-type ATPase [Micrococcaceae bacterium]|nr:copper-translocating P-type ATPase [Micrococcaceae bacterium]